MGTRVVVAYGSKYGATAEIAQRIGDVLHKVGLSVNVFPASAVKSLSEYDAVILGSAVYAGQWTKEAAAFLETHAIALSQRSTWLFSSGPTGTGDPVERMHGWRFPENLRAVADRIRPRDTALFHGRIDPHRLHFGERLIVTALRAETGDFRDWTMIETWAKGIASAMREPSPTMA
jgi:menaquinone-dependent protoporphyrinogen oxidase